MSPGAPIIVSLEGLQLLCEGIIGTANADPYVRLIYPFCELQQCFWCHRLVGASNLRQGICTDCGLRIRGSLAIAKYVCKPCRGEN